jgi:sec-independent protein translocase protein TatB
VAAADAATRAAMFFDLGWSEMLVIGAVALVVIGPKDLPKALRTAGTWARKARTMTRELQGSVEEMIREAELDEVHKDLKKALDFDVKNQVLNTVDPTGELAESIKLPSIPDFFSESRSKPESASQGSPVLTPPPAMIGFDEPAAAATEDRTQAPSSRKPDESAASRA